jgi:ketosteroid isomerase-like protein
MPANSTFDMSDELTHETNNVLNHHLSSFAKWDIDEIMKDYSEQSVLFTPDGVFEGIESIKNLFTGFIPNYLPPGSDFKMIRQAVKGQTAYIVWSAESENYRFPLGTDTFFVKDGKIFAQTFAAKIEPKN